MNYDGEVNESSHNGDSFLSEVCRLNEESCKIFQREGMRVIHLRIGMVLTPNFSLLIGLSSLFSIPIPGVKNHYFPWIHLDDVVGFIDYALKKNLQGPFNLITPEPITHKDFYNTIRKHYKGIIPWILFMPTFIVKMIGDMSELVLYGPKTTPKRTLESGYKFKFNELDAALKDISK